MTPSVERTMPRVLDTRRRAAAVGAAGFALAWLTGQAWLRRLLAAD